MGLSSDQTVGGSSPSGRTAFFNGGKGFSAFDARPCGISGGVWVNLWVRVRKMSAHSHELRQTGSGFFGEPFRTCSIVEGCDG